MVLLQTLNKNLIIYWTSETYLNNWHHSIQWLPLPGVAPEVLSKVEKPSKNVVVNHVTVKLYKQGFKPCIGHVNTSQPYASLNTMIAPPSTKGGKESGKWYHCHRQIVS